MLVETPGAPPGFSPKKGPDVDDASLLPTSIAMNCLEVADAADAEDPQLDNADAACPACAHAYEQGSNFCRMCGHARYGEKAGVCSHCGQSRDGDSTAALDLMRMSNGAPPPPGLGGLGPRPEDLLLWNPMDPSYGLYGPWGHPANFHAPWGCDMSGWPSDDMPALVPESIPMIPPEKLQRAPSEPPAGYPKFKKVVSGDDMPKDGKPTPVEIPRVVSAPPILERTTSLTQLKADPTDNGCSVQWTMEAKKVLEARDKVAVSSSFVVTPSNGPEFPGNFKIILQPKISHERKGGACFKSAKGLCFIQVKWSGDTDGANTSFSKDMELKISVHGCSPTGAQTSQARHNFGEEGVCRLNCDDSDEWNFAKAAEGSRTVTVSLDMVLIPMVE